ncbi:MAG: very short patch repair endonuclease [Terrimicrobiaceae bacterium]
MDTLTAAERTARTTRVRATGNASTELRTISLMRKAGIVSWRRGVPLPGKPDFVFRAQEVALFVDGCFWHGCPTHGRIPKSRPDFWLPKLARNIKRDRSVKRALHATGWTVLRIWECALTPKKLNRTLHRIWRALYL